MDEQRAQEYLNLIENLLYCPDVEQANLLLRQHRNLIDEDLIAVMKQCATGLQTHPQGQDATQWLNYFAERLQRVIALWYTINNKATELYQQGNFTEAIAYGERGLDVARQIWGDEHPKVATSLNNLALLYESQGRYAEAEPLYQDALKMRKRLYGEQHPHIADSLNNLALLYKSQGRYAEAEPLYQDALEMTKRLYGEQHPNIATSLYNLALLYESQGRYAEAEPLLKDALKMDKRLFGEQHPHIAQSLDNLALLYQFQGRYAEAEPLHKKALEMFKHLFGEQHPHIAQSLNNLALLYQYQGRYAEAEPLYQDALLMRKRLFGEQHPDIAQSLCNLAGLYESQGRYEEAEPLHKKALEMFKHLFGEQHPHIATNLNNLALLYYSQGRYAEAEPLYQDALLMRKRLFGEQHPDIAQSLCNLAELYRSQGRYEEAEPLHKKALEMYKCLYGEQHPDIATISDNLALLYHSQGRYKEAEPLYEEALLMRKRLLGEQHPHIATHLNNLALLYYSQGRYAEAEPLYQDALLMRKRLLGEQHPGIAQSLNNLALLYESQEKYEEAEPLYQDALEMLKRLFGEQHPHIVTTLNNLALLYQSQGNPEQALQYLLESLTVEDKIIRQVFANSSERERLRHLNNNRTTFCFFLSLLLTHFYPTPPVMEVGSVGEQIETPIQSAMNVILNRKSLTASYQAAINRAVYSGKYPEARATFEQLRSLHTQIIDITFSPYTPENRQRREHLEAQAETLEREIAQKIPELQLQATDRYAIASQLPPHTTLIEFVRFTFYNFSNKQWQEDRYLALILPSQQPENIAMFDLGTATEIDHLINSYRKCLISDHPDTLVGWKKTEAKPPTIQIRKYNPEPAGKLRQKIIDPLIPALNSPNYLIISADGLLNLIPFEILPLDDPQHTLIMDKYTISYLSSGRDILRYKITSDRLPSPPLIIADPNYNLTLDQSSLTDTNPPKGATHLDISLLDSTDLEPATSTRLLGEFVAEKLGVNAHLQNDALVSHLDPLKCPQVLLIGTHGLFISTPPVPLPNPFTPDRERAAEGTRSARLAQGQISNSLLKSGLAFAGANTWKNKGYLPENAQPGFKFALDLAGLNLWDNDLTLLVACQTGVGDLNMGEGVFGLRRAFAVAGAKTLIMSLWSVPARSSVLLMQHFFDQKAQGLNNLMALREAQAYMRQVTVGQLRQSPIGEEILKELTDKSLPQNSQNCQEGDRPLAHPYYWAAWICQTLIN